MATSQPASVLVVGAGAAGITVAEALRRNAFSGAITIVGAERESPYDRPPLSKQVLSGSWGVDRIQLLTEKRRQALAADLRLGRRAVAIDADRHAALLDDGAALSYDVLVIATGVQPRRLPTSGIRGIQVLRTHVDATALKDSLRPGRNLVVIGGGFLGFEVAATARGQGASVTVVEEQDEPLADRLGKEPAARLVALHREKGVDVRSGVTVTAFHGRPHGAAPYDETRVLDHVELSDGTVVPADVALVAIGCVPCVDWLQDAPLDLSDGLICDEYCRAAPGIWAAGDVASWRHAWHGRNVRVEHRTNANEQGRAVAANILGEMKPFVPAPYFWTDHYDVRIQVCGCVAVSEHDYAEDLDGCDASYVVRYRRRSDDVMVGALAWNAPQEVATHRRELQAVMASSLRQ